MQTSSELPSLAEQLRTLPAERPARNRQLYRLIDLHAAAEGAASLYAATARSREESDVLARAIAAADEVLGGVSNDEASARDRLRDAVTSPEFLALAPRLVRELRQAASIKPETGACTIATAFALWSWTVNYFSKNGGDAVAQIFDELAESLAPLLAARTFALDVSARGAASTANIELRRELCHVYAARTSAAVGTTCAELVFGFRRHLSWDAEGCAGCYAADELDGLEAMIPGFATGGRTNVDVIETDGSHPAKEGPCSRFEGVEKFMRLRKRLDGCLAGARIAKERAAALIERSSADTKGRA